jgi:pyridinium-3,5-bisthiocarboxylic acid mononucleotide nickel chelatase
VSEFSADDQRPTVFMRIAYLDCFSGISGDMFLGALIDAGVSAKIFENAIEALNIGARIEISRVNRSGITATKVDVIAAGEKDMPRDSRTKLTLSSSKGVSDPHGHSHATKHTHHDHVSHHHEAGAPQHGRGLADIREIIGKAALSESAKQNAIAIFEKLGAAESKIHNIAVEKIHFHEVGAVDAIVDIACAAVGADALGVDEIVCSPLNVGGGTVKCAHGTIPVPAPATVELLKGAPVYSSGIEAELVTPTGAAIVATLVKRFSQFPQMRIEKAGYGAGTRDFPGHANVLRIIAGELLDQAFAGEGARATRPSLTQAFPIRAAHEAVTVLEANLDDLNPQVFGYVMDRLLESGALDVFGTPVQMKKNRPGTLLTVLCRAGDADGLAQIIFDETTTLGVRRREEQRQVLARKWQSVSTRFGEVRIKIASLNGTVTSYAPEYEDCRRIAAEQRVPLKMVMQEAMQAYLQSSSEKR